TTLARSMARVMGPTPPGLGATQPATSRTSAATSPASLPSTRDTPTSRTAAPGLTMSAVMRPGTPAAATTMSALRVWAARSRVAGWQSVTVAISVRRGSRRPRERPTVMPPPTTATSAALSGESNLRSSSTMPFGVDDGGGHHGVGPAGVGGEVAGRGVAEGDGRVLGPAGQQEAEGAPDGDAAADDGDLRALDRDVEPAEQLHDALRGARQGARLHE